MISLMFQGFLILLVAFVIGLPVGDLLARQTHRWLRRPRPETERVLAMMAGATPASDPSIPPEPVAPLIYPASVFGHSTVSMSVRRDNDTHAPPAEPFISPSLPPPVQ